MHASLFLTKAYENVFFVTYLLFSQSELLGLCGWGRGEGEGREMDFRDLVSSVSL